MKTKDIAIRQATVADMGTVLKMIKELASFEKEENQVILTESDLKAHGFGRKPLFLCFIAEDNSEILGMALTYPRYSTWKGPTVHLEDLIVRENARNRGVGSLLFNKVVEYSLEQGVKRLEWAVLDWNKKAEDFYIDKGAAILTDWNLAQMSEVVMKKHMQNVNRRLQLKP